MPPLLPIKASALSESGNPSSEVAGPNSEEPTHHELAHADASPEFNKLRSKVTQFFDQILHSAPTKSATHFATVIESTWIVLVLVFSVPMTLTFCPANFSGVRWSLSV